MSTTDKIFTDKYGKRFMVDLTPVEDGRVLCDVTMLENGWHSSLALLGLTGFISDDNDEDAYIVPRDTISEIERWAEAQGW